MQTTSVTSHGNGGQDELHNLHDAVNDIWKLIKTYLPKAPASRDDDAFWEDFMCDCSEVGRSHGNHPVVEKYVLILADYVEEVSRCGTTHPEP